MSSGAHSLPDSDGPPRPFAGHTNKITAIEYSPDGQLIATASEDATVRLWYSRTGQLLQKIETHLPAHSLTFSPSGSQLATICANGAAADPPVANVLVWKMKEGGEGVLEATVMNTEYESDWWTPHLVRFSTDGKLLAVVTSTVIALQDAETGQLALVVHRSEPSFTLIPLLAFTSNNQRILFAGHDQATAVPTVNYYPPTNIVYSFDLATRHRTCINLSTDLSDHLALLVGSYDGAMIAGYATQGSQLWEAYGGKVLQGPLRGHLWGTSFLCFSRDGRWLIDVSRANTVSIWDTSTGNMVLGPLRQPPNLGIKTTHRITSATCSPLKDRVACADDAGHIHVWDVDTEQVLLSSLPDKTQTQPLTAPGRVAVDSVHWFPDGRHFISSSMRDDYIRTWDAETGEQVREYFFRGGSCIALSPDGTLLAAGSACYSGSVIFFNTKTGDEHVHSLDGPSRACRRVLFSPNGSTLAIVLDDAYEKNLCIVFNVLGDCKTVFVQHTSKVLDVAFSPNGEQFSYTTTDDDIPICSTSSMDVISKIPPIASEWSKRTGSVSFSPDGRRLLVGSRGLLVLNLDTNETHLRLHADSDNVQGVFSPDGQSLLCYLYSSPFQMVDVATGDLVRQIKIFDPTCFAFSPGGERIAAGFWNGNIVIYEATTGHNLLPKRDGSLSEEASSANGPIETAGDHSGHRQGPSRREFSLADADDDSLMNMPVATRRFYPGDSQARQNGMFTQRKNSRLKEGMNDSEEPRRGFIARLTSRHKLTAPTLDEADDGHRRMSRMLELVSVGRANLRVMAAGPSEHGHHLRDRRREGEYDESTSSPSPPASTQHRIESPEANTEEERSRTPSSDGIKDILCYCLCIPRCH